MIVWAKILLFSLDALKLFAQTSLFTVRKPSGFNIVYGKQRANQMVGRMISIRVELKGVFES
jgi:hypothetical protein